MVHVLFSFGIVATVLVPSSAANFHRNATATYYSAAAARSNQCKLRNGGSDVKGATFVDFEAHGSWIEFAIDEPTNVVELVVSYSAGKSDYPVDVMIDGKLIDTLKMNKTKDWMTWSRESIVIPTMSGRHTIRLTAGLSRGPCIDWIALRSQQLGLSPTSSGPYDIPTVPPPQLFHPTSAVASTVRTLATSMKGRVPAPTRRTGVQPSSPPTTSVPTLNRSGFPTMGPTRGSTLQPTYKPTLGPTRSPTRQPTPRLTPRPTTGPTRQPTRKPSPGPTRSPTRQPTSKPTPGPTPRPTHQPTSKPTPGRTPGPTRRPTALSTLAPVARSFPFSVVLSSSASMTIGRVVSSPSGQYQFGLYQNGDLQLVRSSNNEVIWRAGMNDAANCFMQSDGNMVTKRTDKQVNWQSHTGNNPGAVLILDDGGQVAIVSRSSALWLAGQPRGQYSGPSSANLVFPVRGAFYYPWYPETWSVNGKPVFYRPTLGKYSIGYPAVQAAHVGALDYAHVDLAIASWWGPDQQLERARITNLLDKSRGTNVKWAVYHEQELFTNPSVAQIRADLDYLKKWYAWHDAWSHIDGRPVIFVYNEGACEVASRWKSASNGEWYVVLKLFVGHQDCPVQPDHWHQYGPAAAVVSKPGYSFTVSPGFWRADKDSPTLARLSEQSWRDNVLKMVNSQEDWQLITTFNEWGEGTAVESAQEWASTSGLGFYLDALNDIH
ncbi:sigma-70 [Fragilaria crotonensis]|nr:sigma-70 [Fragilaria crotonensis]